MSRFVELDVVEARKLHEQNGGTPLEPAAQPESGRLFKLGSLFGSFFVCGLLTSSAAYKVFKGVLRKSAHETNSDHDDLRLDRKKARRALEAAAGRNADVVLAEGAPPKSVDQV